MIRLITVIGHGPKLLDSFITHYTSYVDKICIAVYESEVHPELSLQVSNIISKYDNVEIVKIVRERKFDWGRVTEIYNEVKNLYPDDWWVVADIDEFHLYPNDNLKSMIEDCDSNGWEIIRGGFIDRIGANGEFVDLPNDNNLWGKLSMAGFFRYPMSLACPNKICVVKGKYKVTDGQHYAIVNDESTWRYRGWGNPLIAPIEKYSVQVHHFKWDKTSIDRIKSVADNNQEYSYSLEYGIMYQKLKETNFKVDIENKNYMFEHDCGPSYNNYKNWNKLIKQIIAV